MRERSCPRAHMTSLRWWREVALTTGAVLGVACIVLALASAILDIRPLVFRSGSMSPAIDTGALGISQTVEAADLATGDIVSVKTSDGTRVTHRIVAIARDGSGATLTLKGDDNQVVDAEPYVVTSAERVLFDVPKAGYVVSWLSGPGGIFLLGVYVTFLGIVLFGGGHERKPRGGARSAARPRRRTRAGSAAVVVAGIAVGAGVSHLDAEPTWATWNDTAKVAGGTMQAHYVLPPDAMSCTNGAPVLLGFYDAVTFGITHKSTLYDYVLRVYDGAGAQRGADIPVSSGSTAAGGTVSAKLSANQIAGLLPLGSSVNIRVYAKLKASGSWASTAYRQWRVDTGVLGVLLLNGVKCGADTTGAADTTSPALTFTAPANGVTAARDPYRDVVRNVCGTNRPACGTVTDASGIASISYQLKRVGSTLGTRYFYASSAIGGIWNTDESFHEVQRSGTTWYVEGLVSTAYLSDGSFTLTIRATDNAGNTRTSSITFTLT